MNVNTRLVAWVRERTGMAITPENSSTLTVALRQLARRAGTDPDGYANMILSNSLDAQPFIDAITTHESYFLRHKSTMTFVITRLLPDMMKRGVWPRILSLPCAQGEEPFSLAMMLNDAGIPLNKVSIRGIDIARSSLEQARKAEYRGYALRQANSEFVQRHFATQDENLHRIQNPAIADAVSFSLGNLFALGETVTSVKYHIIFCHNLLIYFDRQKQQEALAILADLLDPEGALFVDISEAQIVSRHLKRLHVNQETVLFKKRDAKDPGVLPPLADPAPFPATRRKPAAPAMPPRVRTVPPFEKTAEPNHVRKPGAVELRAEADALYNDKKLDAAGQAYQALMAAHPKQAPQAQVSLAKICADQGDYVEALENAEMALSSHWADTLKANDRAEAHAIIGLALRQKGISEAAKSHFEEVRKLNPDHPVVRLLSLS